MNENKNLVFLGLGSNIVPRKKWIDQAIEMLSAELEIIQVSNIFQSDPIGYESGSAYLNCALEISTQLSAADLLKLIKEIEVSLLRIKSSDHYEDRTIDIDILFFNEDCVELEKLNIPHPRMHLRNFVIVPLFELCPEKKHPKFKVTIRELYRSLPDAKDLKLFA